jgi:zinc knuckle protein
MIEYLTSIYEDPHRTQNACLKYKGLMMKLTETFATFHTRFLHLAGQAKIPKDDLWPDLFDKLTIELQRTVLPIYSTLDTTKKLADECLSLDQGLRRLKARSERLKSRNAPSVAPPARNQSATATTRNQSATPTREPTPGTQASSRESTPERTRPVYSEPWKQALSIKGACFYCKQEGHMIKDCPSKSKDKTLVVQEVDKTEESGKGQP